MVSNPKINSGFTLVEILIASTILFMTVATATVTYRTLIMSNTRAEQVIATQSVFPLVQTSITQSLRDSFGRQQQGQGELNGWSYRWQASQQSKNPPAARFDPDLGVFTEYQPRYRLFEVSVSLSKNDYTREFKFTELAWDQEIATR